MSRAQPLRPTRDPAAHASAPLEAARSVESRLTLDGPAREATLDGFAASVREGLAATPKRLSCAWFYDRAGSRLFEEICALPEYYLTRAEEEILRTHASEIVAGLPPGADLVELGSGSSMKTRLLIEELLRRDGHLRYVPIDLSRSMLEESSRALLADYPALEVHALAAEYRDGLHRMQSFVSGPRLVLWLGSNVGNFERPAAARFLAELRADLAPGDRVLVGIDLRKDRRTLEEAYDDPRGVTARFNLNLLERINRELGGRFDLAGFRHRALYDEALGRVEMYLESERAEEVAVRKLGLAVRFEAGERIHTENSYKYALREIEDLAAAAGYALERQWLDRERRFSSSRLAPL